MSKSIGGIVNKTVGNLFASGNTGVYGSEAERLNYLNNYDTTNYDNTLKNMTSAAYGLSQQLDKRPDYVYQADGSDAARQRVEQATFNSYVDKLNTQYEQQRNDLNSRLQNQGLSVGSEAYQRAMNDLATQQNEALNQAAYQSVINGQNAFSNSLQNLITAANFTNSARRYPISEIISLLSLSPSGYQVNADKYAVSQGINNRRDAANQQAWGNMFSTADAIGKFWK